MNVLSFHSQSSPNGLSFELTVDGRSLPELLGVVHDDRRLPWWLVQPTGLPCADEPDDPPGRHLVAVCSCGESGCGRTTCVVTSDADTIRLTDFYSDSSAADVSLSFVFTLANYTAVCQAMAAEGQRSGARRRPNTP